MQKEEKEDSNTPPQTNTQTHTSKHTQKNWTLDGGIKIFHGTNSYIYMDLHVYMYIDVDKSYIDDVSELTCQSYFSLIYFSRGGCLNGGICDRCARECICMTVCTCTHVELRH